MAGLSGLDFNGIVGTYPGVQYVADLGYSTLFYVIGFFQRATDVIIGAAHEPLGLPFNIVQSKLAWLVVQAARRLPLLSLLFFSNQWGDNIKHLYFIFAREEYWVRRFLTNVGQPEIQCISLQLLQIFLARVDFMLRFVLGFIYGNHWVGTPPSLRVPGGFTDSKGNKQVPLQHLPVAYSFVGIVGIKDGEADVERGPDDNNAKSFALAEGSLAKQELLTLAQLPEGTHPTTLPSYPPLYLMAEASWLAYEEARVAHSLLTNANFGWVVSGQQEQVIVMEFVSVTYRYPTGIQKERPLNTQLVLFTKGNAVVLAFRGSQPISFFDWFYNFTLASGTGGNSYAAMGSITEAELSGYRAKGQGLVSKLLGGKNHQGIDTQYVRLHEGFATDLGLELHPNEDPAAAGMTPISFRVLCYAPQGFHHISPTPDAGELQAPRIFDLPADREALLKPNAVARHAHIGSPYAFIRALLTEELDSNPAAHLYVTGHSLGGALASVFATKFGSDATAPVKERMNLVTFGEPLSGGLDYSNIKQDLFVTGCNQPRYARVVQLNDGVPRIPQYFPDTGERFHHADGAGVVYYIDANNNLQGGGNTPLPENREPKYQQLALRNWQGIAAGWQALSGFTPGDQTTFQSSWRFFLRILLAPTGMFNDHLDYKAALRTHTRRVDNRVQPEMNGHSAEFADLAARLAKHVSY